MRGSSASGVGWVFGVEADRLARLGQAVVLDRAQDGVGVAVVELADVDILGSDAGHLVGGLAGDGRTGGRADFDFGVGEVAGVALSHAPDVGGRGLEVAGAFCRRHDRADGAVGDEAAVEQVERFHDPAGVVVVLERQGLAHGGVGVVDGVASLGDGDAAEVVVGDAEALHVASGGERVGGVGAVEAECGHQRGHAAGSSASRAAVGGSGRAALLERRVGEDAGDVVGHAVVDGHGGVLDHRRGGRAEGVHVIEQTQVA